MYGVTKNTKPIITRKGPKAIIIRDKFWKMSRTSPFSRLHQKNLYAKIQENVAQPY